MHKNAKLDGKVALVAGATRGAGRAIAIELSRAGAFVYATGRSSKFSGPSDIDRPETIEETEELMLEAGGKGKALRVDHLDVNAVRELVKKIETDHGQLDILINDIFGGDRYMEWDKKLWEHDITGGLKMLRMGIDTHLITSAIAIPLLLRTGNGLIIEMTDGTFEYNVNFRKDVGFYYDMVKAAVGRIVIGLTAELKGESCTAVGVTPGWLRSEAMLQNFGVGESNWRDAVTRDPHFCISESPAYVARGIAELASDPNKGKWGGKILSSAELSKVYGTTDIDGTRPDCWRYLVEVQDKGLPADDTGYR